MTDEKRKPWMRWYPSDWRADPALRMCGYAARGLWADMLALMHEAVPYGHLMIRGISPTPRQLAGVLGGSEKEVAGLIQELEENGVFSRSESGTIYSRRMVRDKAKEDADRENGKGGGNPTLTEKSAKGYPPKPRGGLTPRDNPQRLEARSQKPEAREVGAGNAAAPLDPPQPKADLPGLDPEPKPDGLELPTHLDHRNDRPPPEDDDLDRAVEAYNAAAERHGWATCQKLTLPRMRQLRARLRDCGGLDGWQSALAKAEASSFLTGRTPRGPDHQNWKVDFDFFVRDSSFTKLMEGKYDDAPRTPKSPGSLGGSGVLDLIAANRVEAGDGLGVA